MQFKWKERNQHKTHHTHTQNELHFSTLTQLHKNRHRRWGAQSKRKYWNFNRILKSYARIKWMMHSKDFCEKSLKWNAKWKQPQTAPAAQIAAAAAALFIRWLAVRIPNNNEGSNANEFISMQFKSISSCITFHTVCNHSYSNSIYICLFQSLSSVREVLWIFFGTGSIFDIQFST